MGNLKPLTKPKLELLARLIAQGVRTASPFHLQEVSRTAAYGFPQTTNSAATRRFPYARGCWSSTAYRAVDVCQELFYERHYERGAI